jgi:flagellar protein FliS
MIPVRRYAQTQVTTASRERVLKLLMEAVPRRIAAGIAAIEGGEKLKGGKELLAASNIVLELERTLDARAAPELCETLARIYRFVALRLSNAALKKDPRLAREALTAFQPIADGFIRAIEELAAGKPAATGTR